MIETGSPCSTSMTMMLLVSLFHGMLMLHHHVDASFQTFTYTITRASTSPFASFNAISAGTPLFASTTTTSDKVTTERLKEDIALLKRQAVSRLDVLVHQMEELKDSDQKTTPSPSQSMVQKDEAEITVSTTTTTSTTTVTTPSKIMVDGQHEINKVETSVVAPPEQALDQTLWKIVFNIGRENGTWMPTEWGRSGDRLLLQCTVEFTGKSADATALHDEFFHSNQGIKLLQISNAFVISRGVGLHSVGRQPLPVLEHGAYKICRGEGPAGTDLVRFFIQLTNRVDVPDHASDVHCPVGRVYGTCGYFSTTPGQRHHEQRDEAQRQYLECVARYEHHQTALADCERNHPNAIWEHWQKRRAVWLAQHEVDEAAQVWHQAKLREPEKSQLRLTKMGDVALSREGGICAKVHKGLALEYHILGRVEVGCVEDHHH